MPAAMRGGLHVMLVNEVVQDEVVQVAFVAGHEDQAAPLAGLSHLVEPLGIKGNAVEEVLGTAKSRCECMMLM